MKSYRDYNNTINTARVEGMEEGKLEEKKIIAKSLLLSGMEVKEVAKHTTLSVEVIEEIKRGIN